VLTPKRLANILDRVPFRRNTAMNAVAEVRAAAEVARVEAAPVVVSRGRDCAVTASGTGHMMTGGPAGVVRGIGLMIVPGCLIATKEGAMAVAATIALKNPGPRPRVAAVMAAEVVTGVLRFILLTICLDFMRMRLVHLLSVLMLDLTCVAFVLFIVCYLNVPDMVVAASVVAAVTAEVAATGVNRNVTVLVNR